MTDLHQSMTNSTGLAKVIESVLELHRPVPTGRVEYTTDGDGAITGTAPTYYCPNGCHARVYFEGDGCATFNLITKGIEEDDRWLTTRRLTCISGLMRSKPRTRDSVREES